MDPQEVERKKIASLPARPLAFASRPLQSRIRNLSRRRCRQGSASRISRKFSLHDSLPSTALPMAKPEYPDLSACYLLYQTTFVHQPGVGAKRGLGSFSRRDDYLFLDDVSHVTGGEETGQAGAVVGVNDYLPGIVQFHL